MKAEITLLLVLIVFTAKSTENLSLINAEKKGYISYEITSNNGSIHYYKPLKLKLRNLKNFGVNINIQLGDIIIPEDSIYQKFIITNQEMICLTPMSETTIELLAMCIESNDIAPLSHVMYYPSQEKKSSLMPLLQLIQNKRYFKPEAQYAVWAAFYQRQLNDIYGADTVAEKELLNVVADITKQSVPVRNYNSEDYRNNYYSNNMKIKMGGSFDYKLSQAKSISIAMFDKNNVIVRELFVKDKVNAGTHHFDYYFDASVYTDDFYYIRLIADGNIKLEIKIDMPRN